MNNYTAAMITIPERETIRLQTLSNLAYFEIYPDVVIQDVSGRGGIFHKNNVLQALKTCSKDYLLFVEDDIEVCEQFPRIFENCLMAGKEVITFYISANKQFYPYGIRGYLNGNFPMPDEGIYRVNNRKNFFGSQCVLLRSDAIQKLIAKWNDETYFDNLIGKVIKDFWLYFPNPVQHAGAKLKSTWSVHGQTHQSITYDLWGKHGNI